MNLFSRKRPAAGNGLRPFLSGYPSHSRFAEAYRTLRTNVHFSAMDKAVKTVLITSAGQGEGKTSTVFNFAYTLAATGKSVLMIDADLRRPILSSAHREAASAGLTGLVSGVFSTAVKAGDLSQMNLGDLIHLLAFQKKSGRLHLEGGGETVELTFYQGEPVDLDWLTRPGEKKLAKALMRDGLLTQEQVRSALVRQKDTGQKLGTILVGTGMLAEDQLNGLLSLHMMEGLRVAMQMNRGRFRFRDMDPSRFDRSAYNPFDLEKLYHRLVVGEEGLAFLAAGIGDAVIPTGHDRLFLLPSGTLPPNPSELLGADRIRFLFEYLEKQFDALVIDTPPLLPASDALLLAPKADGVLLVVKAGMMNREPIRDVVEQLRTAQAHLLGVVLNQVDITRNGDYRSYYRYYSHYYGQNPDG